MSRVCMTCYSEFDCRYQSCFAAAQAVCARVHVCVCVCVCVYFVFSTLLKAFSVVLRIIEDYSTPFSQSKYSPTVNTRGASTVR